MSDLRPYLWLIPGLPLIASAMIAFLGPRLLRRHSHWPCILGIAGSFLVSLLVFLQVYGAHPEEGAAGPVGIAAYYPWIQAGSVDIGMTLRADALSAMMLVMITFIATFIAIYAVGYMHGEAGYPRFFAAVALFVFSMTLLVLGDNFLVMFAGWEGVGLCSYLLIGFWFYKDSAAAAARKALLVTRIGDVGLLMGIFLLWNLTGSFDYDIVFAKVKLLAADPANEPVLFAAALLLFCGAAGKSAQFPLHVWLPDAMEGPTPVSALIHAATMVTAGVYLLARCTPVFMAAPDAQLVVACLGGFTAVLAALIALTQNDLKRVMAYSTLSQLGYMFLALGCATMHRGPHLVTFAVVAAMFHLFTHAFFKALLFLSSGSVMIAMGHVIDMRRFSGLRHVMPITHATFLVGALALSGFPLLSGFWSKDEILDACYQASTVHGTAGSVYSVLLVSAVLTAGLTAFYTFRAYFKTFWGEIKVPPEAFHHADHGDAHSGHADSHGSYGGHGHTPAPTPTHGHLASHESPAVMTIPLVVLAVFAVGVGLVLGPTHLFARFLEKSPGLPYDNHPDEINWMLMGISTVVVLAGMALAYVFYVLKPELPGKIAKSAQNLYQVSLNKFYIDEIYNALIIRPMNWVAARLKAFDMNWIDGLVDLTGKSPGAIGELFRPIQNGLVQFYALAMVLGLTVFLLSLIYKL
jgi:NADH-quinone oxidoreductase subunit L